MKLHHFYNVFNLGDQLLNLKFLYNNASILEKEKIQINYYFSEKLPILELEKYTDRDTVKLIPVKDFNSLPPSAIELWMAHPKNGVHFTTFDNYFFEFYKNITSILGLESYNICYSLYQQEDYLLNIYESLDSKYKNLDILILNNVPMSGQYSYNKGGMDILCRHLNSKYNVAVSTYVNDNIKCTEKDGLSIQEIGAISTHCNYIVAVHSGPITSCYNSYTKRNVKKWFILRNCNIHNTINHTEINALNTTDLNVIKNFFDQL